MEKGIHWEQCKKFKFNHKNKWYMHKPKSVLDTHKFLWDFEIQTDHLLLAKWRDLKIVNKKTKENLLDFAVPADQRVKLKEFKKRDNYQDLAGEVKKPTEHGDDSDATCNLCTWNNPQKTVKETGRLGNKRTSRDHSDDRLLRSARILRRVLETWGDLLSL